MIANNSYAKEAESRWPKEYVESNLKLKSMSKADQKKLFELGDENIKNVADAFVMQKSVLRRCKWYAVGWTIVMLL